MSQPEGATPSNITEHSFSAVPWWERCEICGIGAPAHAEMSATSEAWMRAALRDLRYRCPYCVDRLLDPCSHERAGALGLDGEPLKEQSA
jgi:hypothetical protein